MTGNIGHSLHTPLTCVSKKDHSSHTHKYIQSRVQPWPAYTHVPHHRIALVLIHTPLTHMHPSHIRVHVHKKQFYKTAQNMHKNNRSLWTHLLLLDVFSLMLKPMIRAIPPAKALSLAHSAQARRYCILIQRACEEHTRHTVVLSTQIT